MGNDGGTINKARKLQVNAARDNSHSPSGQDLRQFQDVSRWKCCRLTNKKLRLPVVSDAKGHLFNKESVLEWLLTPEREDFSDEQIEQFAHIRKLNDVVDLRGLQERDDYLFCEFSGDALGKTNVKFAYISTCGDVLPRRSLNLLSETRCPKCDKSFEKLDVITLNPADSELEMLKGRMRKLDELRIHHDGKSKAKRRKKVYEARPEGSIKRPRNLSKHNN